MARKSGWFLHFFYILIIIVLSVLLGTKLGSSAASKSPARSTPRPATLQTMTDLESAFSDIAEKTAPSVVNINTEQVVERRDPREDFFREYFGQSSPFTYKERMTNLGSGVIVDRRGYVLTNVHVIKGADAIRVKTADGTSYQATPVASSPAQDLAIIKLQTDKTFPAAVLGDADKVRVGSWAIAVGSPFGFTESVTVGVISAKGRIIGGGEGQKYRDLLQTDASINPGNSGGPLLNLRGEVIGINQAIFSPERVNIGIGFAIPMTPATRQAITEAINQS